MHYKVLFLLLVATTATRAAPTTASASPSTASPTSTTTEPADSVEVAHNPHIITLERFENLLRQAGEFFRPSAFQLVQVTPAMFSAETPPPQQPAVPTPYQQIQPPTEQPYNFYLPMFEQYDNAKLDAKSRRMESFAPPPEPSKHDDSTNYYALKPKKLPKKFNGGAKQVNLKWLNAFEKEAMSVANSGDESPKAVYLANDERNRINFDDSFFAVDMHVKEAHNEVAPKAALAVKPAGEDDFLNQGEELTDEEDDLLAASAMQVPQIVQNFRAAPRA